METETATIEWSYDLREIPGVVNDERLTARAVEAVARVVGSESTFALDLILPMFSDDFGWMLAEVPGAMFFLGVSNTEKNIFGVPHMPGFSADEESIFIGTSSMAAVILDLMEGAPGS